MAIQLAQAYVAIVPSMAGVGEAISKAFGGVSASVGAASGKSIGSAITKAVSSSLKTNPLAQLEQDVKFAQQDVESAMRSMKTSTLAAQAAQLKYNETVAKYGENSSQAVSAEKRLVSAKYSNEDASNRLTSSEKKLQTAQESLSKVRLKGPDTSASENRFSSFIQRVKSSFSNLQTSSYGTKAANDFSTAFAAKMGAITGIVSSAMSRVLSSITSNISDAVSRADTLNNFPKIMTQLGYSATDASSQVQRLSDRITGLPTTLDSIVGSVKRLAPISSSLSNATDIALAFNDAIVAGGASTELQSNAMEQFLQIMSAGKVDLQAWKSIENAMPAQLTEVSRSLLGQSANTMTLYEALKDGTVSMSDFTAKVVELDSKGGAGFNSFENQAKAATSGIGTNMTNLKTAITRGMANVFQAVRPQINGGIQSITGTVNNASKDITTFVSTLANTGALQTFGNAASALGKAVMSVIQPIIQAVAGMLGFNSGATTASGSAKMFASFIKTAAGHLQEFAKWISANKDYLGPLVVGILTAVAAIKIATVAIGIINAVIKIATVAIGIINAVMYANPIMLVVVALAAVTAALVYFFTQTKTGQAIWSGFMSWLQSAWTAISGFFSGLWSGIVGFFTGAANNVRNAWNAVTGWFGSIPGRISGFFSGIGAAIGGFFSSAANNVRSTWDNVVNWFKGIPGRIIGFFSDAGKWLWDAGSNIVKGLWDGLKSKFEDVKNWVGGIGDWIKEHKGPKAYDLNLLVDNGGWIMQSLATGLKQGFDATVTPYVLSRGSALQNMISTPTFSSSTSSSASRSGVLGTTVNQYIYPQQDDPRIQMRLWGREASKAMAGAV